MRAPPTPWPPRDAAHLLVTSGQMAALEAELFAHGLPVEALMEKAALALSRCLLATPETLAQGTTVLVGPGHNGGDGLVVARELHLAGQAVRIWTPFERHKPLTARHLEHARWLGIDTTTVPPDPAEGCLWIDGLFGVGQARPLPEALETLLAERERRRPGRLVAIDVPSGLCADSGRPLGQALACARTTYCLGLIKQGLVQDPALAWVGELRRIDLGLPAHLLAGLPEHQPLALGSADRAEAPCPRLAPAEGKYQRGRLLVISGSLPYRGASHLALLGASASGCGSLRAALPKALAEGLWAVQPHVVVERSLACHGGGSLNLEPLAAPGLLERLDAVLLGPGIGAIEPQGPEAEQERASWAALGAFAGLLVLDADGLNRLAQRPQQEASTWLRGRAGPTWITPHAGEFARLFPDLGTHPPLEAAVAAAQRSRATVLLKGARSVVAAAPGGCWQVLEANAAAARAGLGDVLAGYAAGRGAMAMAADGAAGGDLLAAIALDHALAGGEAARKEGGGGATPMAVAAVLAQRATT